MKRLRRNFLMKGLASHPDALQPPSKSWYVVSEHPPRPLRQPKLLDQVRLAIRTRHFSPRTEEAYVGWIRKFILYHNKRHPTEMAEPEVTRFLSSLATEG